MIHRKFFLKILPFLDLVLALVVYPAAVLLKMVRVAGVHRLPRCKQALMKVGVFPIRDHYYEPQFNNGSPSKSYFEDRNLPGIDWATQDQLKILDRFCYSSELSDLSLTKTSELEFYFGNGAFESGDAEYWYQLVRAIKPKRIFEIGSGNSTLIAVRALQKNHQEDVGIKCEHICIEPYEMPWLEKIGVLVVREKVENMDLAFFSRLQENDILFIDSSHVIRPQGDVLFEYLELLPSLNKGVIVHIHDIFSPKNYLTQWLECEVKFWNEQYLLEAFLSHNKSWKIVGALNYLRHNHYNNLKRVAPFLTADREPGSFYIQKIA
ncbi:class I SAM-dependent methyltransferase [Hydrocarboniphaga sp.]|uniref:class I SAM-dependent methyltransferase n=1 Tax=Hydrocarboniphaga sp. TaxID=2033016 RepID=UPI0026093630|nr:class I SAM-dependent methyltransferase [Hydrocarboniphaga sp.]